MHTEVQPIMGLDAHGIVNVARTHWNLTTSSLYEEAIRRREGLVADQGPLVCRTGHHTGRSPNDKFVVKDASTADRVWWGKVNRPVSTRAFRRAAPAHAGVHGGQGAVRPGLLRRRRSRPTACPSGSSPEYAWHSLFARHMFIPEPDPGRSASTITRSSPSSTCRRFHADPALHGTASEVFILINFAKGLVLIGGTSYAGEIKKSIFTVMNYLLPMRNVMPMHCSANVGADGDVALFFGLSGTGKTTLVERPGPAAHRRRRARLERSRRVQLRGRLLREDDPALCRGRAADLRDDPAIRHGARERVDRRGHAAPQSRRRGADREHPRRLPDRVHRQLGGFGDRRTSPRTSSC